MTTPTPQPEAPTPETDAKAWTARAYSTMPEVVDSDVCRVMERQRDEAIARLEIAMSPEIKDAIKDFTVDMMWTHKARADKAEAERAAARAELARVTKERDSLADQLAISTRTVENYEALTKRYVAALEVESSKLRAANLS